MGQTKARRWIASLEESRARGPQAEAKRRGSKANRGRAAAWTRSARIRHQLMDEPTSSGPDRTGMRRSVHDGAGMAHSARSGMELPTADGQGLRTQRAND